jgi:Na+/H+-dicarboxylate symporter
MVMNGFAYILLAILCVFGLVASVHNMETEKSEGNYLGYCFALFLAIANAVCIGLNVSRALMCLF